MRRLFINLDEDDPAKAFVTSFTDSAPLVELPKWPRSDSKPLQLIFLRRNPDVNADFPFSYVDPSGFSSVKFGGGVIGATPDGGTFTLTDPAGAQTTTAIAYNAPASGVAGSVQTVMRATLTTNYSSCTVTGDAGGPYFIDRGTTGAIADLTATATSLSPDGSTIAVTNTQAGSATLNERCRVKLVKALPILKASGWTALPAAAVTIDVVLAGGASQQKTWRLYWNSDAYGGAVLLSSNGGSNTRNIGPLSFNSNADDVADAFALHPDYTADGASVVRNGPGDFTITILGAAGRSGTPSLSEADNTLLVPLGLTAVVSVATAGADDILDGEEEADITIEVEIREASGEPNTCAQGSAKIIADLMEGTPGQSTGTEQWATIGDAEDIAPHVWADDAERLADSAYMEGQLGFQLDTLQLYRSNNAGVGAFAESDFQVDNLTAIFSIVAGFSNNEDGLFALRHSSHGFQGSLSAPSLTGNRSYSTPNANGTLALLGTGTDGAGQVAQGGTGITSYTTDHILYATGATTLSTFASTALTRGLITDPLDPDYLVLKEDFVGGNVPAGLLGELGWTPVNITSSATMDYITATTNRPGLVQITTGTLDNDGGALALNYGTAFSEAGRIPPLNALTGWKIRFSAKIDATTSISIRWGLAVDPNTVEPANGIYWQYDTDATDSNFSAVCRSASTSTKTASSVAADTNYHVFEIYSNSSGTITFQIDGGTAINITTNIPSIALSPFFNIATRTTAAKSCTIDFWSFLMTVAR